MSRSRSDRAKWSPKLGYKRWVKRNTAGWPRPRDVRREEVEERGYVRCDFVPLYGRPRPAQTPSSAIEILWRFFTPGGSLDIGAT